MIMRLALLAVFAVTTSYSVVSAEVIFSADKREILITGPIDIKTKTTIESMRDSLIEYSPKIVLDSVGGDVDSAIEIGRLIRDLELWTIVEKNSRCYSSCALIFIAGVERFNVGEIGLHRPYVFMDKISTVPTSEQIRSMYRKIQEYIQLMNVDDQFFRIMMETPPEDVKIYRHVEITTYELMINNPNDSWLKIVPTTDPAHEDIQTIRRARRHKLDTVSYRRKAAEAERYCLRKKDVSYDCREARIWGLTIKEYKERSKVRLKCLATTEEWKQVSNLKKSDLYNHPIFIKNEDCRYAIYKGL